MPSKLKIIEKEKGLQAVSSFLLEQYAQTPNIHNLASDLQINQSTLSYWVARSGLEFKTVLVRRGQGVVS